MMRSSDPEWLAAGLLEFIPFGSGCELCTLEEGGACSVFAEGISILFSIPNLEITAPQLGQVPSEFGKTCILQFGQVIIDIFMPPSDGKLLEAEKNFSTQTPPAYF